MNRATIVSLVVLGAAALAGPANAGNMNRCVGESAGLGGYQFKNNCGVPVNVYYRPGGLDGAMGGGSWRYLTLRSGEMKVVNGYSSPIIACPTSHEGKPVSIDPKSRDCIIRDR